MAIPDRVRRATSLWSNTGQQRPGFAIAPTDAQESVWDYPRPPAIVPDEREVVVCFRGVEIARTVRALRVCETASPPTFYLPAVDVSVAYLVRSSARSCCEWKGQATYWSLAVDGHPRQSNIGWSYERPFPDFSAIQGCFSFYPSRVECRVEGRIVEAQPGGFYGGWITPEIVGPFKGDPGTSGW